MMDLKFNDEGVTQTNSYGYLGSRRSSRGSLSSAVITQNKKGIEAMFAQLLFINLAFI